MRRQVRGSGWAAAMVVMMCTAAFVTITTGTARASYCSGGPAVVLPTDGWRTIQANHPRASFDGTTLGYRVTNAGDNNIAVQVKGYDTTKRFPDDVVWKGFPLGPGGAFDASMPWGNSLAYPAIKVMNLGGRLGTSVSFDC